MGWASGSQLAEGLYAAVRKYIPKEKRAKVAETFLREFEIHDADDWDVGSKLWGDSGREIEVWEDDDAP